MGAQILEIGAGSVFWVKWIGIQSGSSRDPVGHPNSFLKKQHVSRFLQGFGTFLGASGQDPDWILIGQKCQKMQNCCPTVSQLDPNWIHRSARNHSRTAFAPIFPCPDPPWPLCSFSAHQYHPIPPLLHQNGKSSLKPNGSSTRYNGNLPSGVKKIALMKIPSKWMSLAGKASN